VLSNYRLVPETKGEEDLLRFIENHIEDEKDMVLAIIKDMRDNPDTGSNNAGRCYEGCPPQIGDDFLNSWIEELDAPEKELFLLFWVKDGDVGQKLFAKAAQTRLNNIKRESWYDPEIHKVHAPPIQTLNEVQGIIKGWTKHYGGKTRIKTREIGFFSHAGNDGPVTHAGNNPPLHRDYSKQMAIKGGWDSIDFNWKDSDTRFVIYGCSSKNFAKNVSGLGNFTGVETAGQSTSSYASMYPDYSVVSPVRAASGNITGLAMLAGLPHIPVWDTRENTYMIAREGGLGWKSTSFNENKDKLNEKFLQDYPVALPMFFYKNGHYIKASHQGIFNDHRK